MQVQGLFYITDAILDVVTTKQDLSAYELRDGSRKSAFSTPFMPGMMLAKELEKLGFDDQQVCFIRTV